MSSTSYECSAIAMKYLTKKVKTKEELLGKGVKAKKYQDLSEFLRNLIADYIYLLEE